MEDRSQEVLAVAVLFFAMSWLAVMLRVYVRIILLKSWGLDDWAMAVALLCFTIYLICQLGGVYYGTGRHYHDLDESDFHKGLGFWWLCEIFYVLSSTSLKVAIGLFLLRIAVNKQHIVIIHVINAASIVFGLAYVCVVAFQCTPVHTFWTIRPNNPNCLPRDTVANVTYAASALASFADWTFGILPGFIVWDLHMNKRTKIVVVGILGFAAIGSTATLVRIPFIKGLKTPDDFLWTSTDIAIWSTIEPGIGITAACIATLRPLLQMFLHRTGLSTHSHTNTTPFTPNWGSGNHLATKGRAGYIRSGSFAHGMETLRPDYSGTTTTVTGRGDKSWRCDSDDNSLEENVATSCNGVQINKTVQITHITEEAAEDHHNHRISGDDAV
ncbi:uncharacterized protein K452DRAFT_326918 [Aplosporella prunicola CBS 121167]|uniref:Rhodopsin domain-containing protein n=1 Tax=Aplosporella prunicola CBS 121167 TaxID=1176127 RepID=A0A6A6BCE9_9PEZI|nr:uncharacterized protein K452DRAFT_326918 [Aplosporella prunicola CBS 121167]KAF2141892.1 hypothetical protein K452DRAFT_326918 [Aplosporella prunicola CBS 121167]